MLSLNQISIPSTDIDVSIKFYRKLGLELIVSTTKDYARFLMPDRVATLSLRRVSSISCLERIWVYMESDNLDAEVAELSDSGVQFESQPKDKAWMWREAKLKDPDGNIIVFYSAGEYRVNPPWSIKNRLTESE